MQRVTWIWIRHLRAIEAEGIVCGRLDLSADLRDEARIAALARELPKDAALLSSPLARCRETLSAVRAAGGCGSEPEIEPDFVEQSFGDWEGRRYADLDELSTWTIHEYADRSPPGGESFAAMSQRVAAAIDRRNSTATNGTFVVCAHAGVIRAALAHALKLPPSTALAFAIDCASRTQLVFIPPREWRIDYVNDRS